MIQLEGGIAPAPVVVAPIVPVVIVPKVPVVNTPVVSNPVVAPKSLKLGMTGDDVKALQIYLNTHGYTISASGSGSLGNENTYFSVNTMLSVILFQKDKGLSPSGVIDPSTWETMN